MLATQLHEGVQRLSYIINDKYALAQNLHPNV